MGTLARRMYAYAAPTALVAAGLALVLSGCAKSVVDKPQLAKVKTVAVLLYTTPTEITYRNDPRDAKSKSLLQAVVGAAAAGKGDVAAEDAYVTFTETLQQQKLPFRVLSASEVRDNPGFKEIDAPRFSYVVAPKTGLSSSLAMVGFKSPEREEGSAPKGMPQFGLPAGWGASPLTGSKDEKEYLMRAMKALNVDAAIVVADPGMGWGCNACVGTDTLGWTGVGSTTSAYVAIIVNPDVQVILAQQEWFKVGDGSGAMTLNAVNPLEHEKVFKGHGTKMARVFADSYREAVEKK